MWQAETSTYIGSDNPKNAPVLYTAGTFFFVGSGGGTHTKEHLSHAASAIYKELNTRQQMRLADFENTLSETLGANVHSSFDCACGVIVKGIIYLLVKGNGAVYIERGGEVVCVVNSGKTASGRVKDGDMFVFANGAFLELVDNFSHTDLIIGRSPKEIVEEVAKAVGDEEREVGAAALFALVQNTTGEPHHTMTPANVDTEPIDEIAPNHRPSLDEAIHNPPTFMSDARTGGVGIFDRFKNRLGSLLSFLSGKIPAGKRTTLVITIMLFMLLVWSVVFGAKRRARSELMANVKQSEEIINQKLIEATDVAILNLDRSQALFSEIKQEIAGLKKQAGEMEIPEITMLEKKIIDTERSVVKRENRKTAVFYDLALIAKDARGSAMHRSGEDIAILDSAVGKIYVISLTKKSVRTIRNDRIKGAERVSLYDGLVYFFNSAQGVYRVDADDDLVEVSPVDDEWGEIVDIKIYNGNVYLLDSAKEEIYKYTVVADGYSAKSTYFKSGQSVKMDTPASLAIDSSVYVGLSDRIVKYVSGTRESFAVSFPDQDIHNFTKLYTDTDVTKLYLLEKDKAKLYIISKTGQYEKQIESSTLKEALDFTVFDTEKKVYILTPQSIYEMDL